MSLEHKLRITRPGVPELNRPILGSGQDPVSIGGESDGEDKVLVAFEGTDATAAACAGSGHEAASGRELPHLDGAVERAGDEVLAVGGEGDGVHRVPMTLGTLKTLNEVSGCSIPNTDRLVERTSSNITSVRRDGNGCDTILNGEGKNNLSSLDIPNTDGAIPGTGSNMTTIASKVERVNVLVVARESVCNLALSNVPHTNQLVLSTGSEEASVGREADGTNVQVAFAVDRLVLEVSNWLSSLDVEDLSSAVATRGNIPAVVAETHAADYGVVLKGVDEVDVKLAHKLGVVDDEPVGSLLLLRRGNAVNVEVSQGVAYGRRRARTGDLRRATVVGLLVGWWWRLLLRSLRSSGNRALLVWGRAWWGVRSVACSQC